MAINSDECIFLSTNVVYGVQFLGLKITRCAIEKNKVLYKKKTIVKLFPNTT